MSINNTAMFKLSYGLFVLTASDGRMSNGCIINTCTQLTQEPLKISICVNKSNYTHELISNSGVFTVSILSEKAPFDIFKRFGFASGRDTNKFYEFTDCEIGENNLPHITGNFANAFISGKVIEQIDCGTHTLFIADVTEAEVLNNDKSMTYEYYFANVKPKPQPEKKRGYVCKICGYVHEGDELPADFICPICKHPASDFEPLK